MTTESPASQEYAGAYDSKPWLQQYPKDVPTTLAYRQESIWEALEDVTAQHPDKTAFVFQKYGITFKELKSHSERMSGALARAGVGKGDVVLLLLPNIPHFPIAYYGALRIGACVAAAPPTSVEREIEYLIKDSGAKVVITLDLLYDKVSNIWERNGIRTVVIGSVADFMPPWIRLFGRATGKVPRPKEPVPFGGPIRSMLQFLRMGRSFPPPAAVDTHSTLR